MSANTRLVVTDGTPANTVSMTVDISGTHVTDFLPKSPGPASSIWSSSPYQDGKHLVNKTYDNIVDTFTVVITKSDMDTAIHELRRFIVLLEKAVLYWTDEFNTHKYWLELRGDCETNIRYALVVDYNVPEIQNPYEPPFSGGVTSIIENVQILIEHTIWTDELLVGENCVKISTGTDILTNNIISAEPQVSLDDAHIWNGQFFGNILMEIGVFVGFSFTGGIRFKTVAIPANALITRAWIEFTAVNTLAFPCSADIWIEDNVAPAIFSDFADFTGRVMMGVGVGWPNIVNTVPFQKVNTPDISLLIQYIVGKAGWVFDNDIAIFITDDGSASTRMFGTMDTPAYHSAILHVEYVVPKTVIFGELPTCLRGPAVQPLYRDKNLSYAFNYDDSTGNYSTTLVANGAMSEEDLFPGVPAVDDYLCVCISDVHDPDRYSPFNTLVIYLASVGVDITGVDAQYWNGAWVSLVNLVEEPNPFWDAAATLGLHYLMWEYPDDWVLSTENAIDGLWVRFIITGVGGAPVTPKRDPTKSLYTISWPNIQVSGTELQGDINTLINFLLSNRSAAIDRIMISARKYSRTNGGRFTAYIPFNTHVFLPDAVYSPVTVSESQTSEAYSGWLATWVPGAPGVTHNLANFDLNPKTYAGRFRAFVRGYVYAPTDIGNIGLYLLVQLGGGGYYTTPVVYNVADHGDGEVYDLGLIAFPPEPNEETVTTVHPWTISLMGKNTLATDALVLYDLILMPVDEAHVEIEINSALSHHRNTFYYPWKIVTTNFKLGAYGFTLLNYTPMLVDWNDEIVEALKVNILGAFDIEPEEDYWLIFFAYESQSIYNLGGLHLFEHLIAPNLDKNQRFLLARGDE